MAISVCVFANTSCLCTQEFTLSTNRGLGFGLCIEGGMNAPPGNPFDPADDGIFVSHVR